MNKIKEIIIDYNFNDWYCNFIDNKKVTKYDENYYLAKLKLIELLESNIKKDLEKVRQNKRDKEYDKIQYERLNRWKKIISLILRRKIYKDKKHTKEAVKFFNNKYIPIF